MAFEWGYLRTRVARRVLFLFFLGALVPVLFMAGASFQAMSDQLRDQSEERLRQVSRNARQAVMQQLMLTASGMRVAGEALRGGRSAADLPVQPRLQRLGVIREGGALEPLLGAGFDPPPLDEGTRAHLEEGEMLLRVLPGTETPVLAAVRVSLPDGPEETLWATVESDSIWGAAERFASGQGTVDFCVLSGHEPLYCRSGGTTYADAFLAAPEEAPASGSLVASTVNGDVVIGHALVFLEAAFAASPLRLLVVERVDDLYTADLSLFRYSFGISLLLGILVVLLLASIQVRRTMEPLEALSAGTTRLAQGDLDARVPIQSRDEFGELARSFNGMAGRLGRQFHTLEVGRAVDRAVLSAMDVEGVVGALMSGFDQLVSCRSLALLLLKPGHDEPPTLHWTGAHGERKRSAVTVTLEDRRWLSAVEGHRVVADSTERPPLLRDTPAALGAHPLVVLPLTTQGKLVGAVVFESDAEVPPPSEVIALGRQVADQATVALDAVRLVGELEAMNWGALRALARAIDAKSRWTAGHSERVTELSLRLGGAMGLPEDDMEVLRRGGLLHDVGKIGVPHEVLDSPGRLTPRQWTMVREHPTIGARILEPIRAFGPALPIVLQHHERWDGKGYPAGLAGTEIHPLARIVAVADTFDAMASPRPYRDALDRSVVMSEMKNGSGTQFEPFIVEVFLEVMSQADHVHSPVPEYPDV